MVYVDKTEIIYRLVQKNYIFLSRPRRFGKSLLLSTIKAYFEGKKHLFEGLKISQFEKSWEPRPVFHLELSRSNPYDADSLEATLTSQIRNLEEKYKVEAKDQDLSSRFANLIIKTSEKTGKGVVILIDEYDNPLINTLEEKENYDKNRELLKSLYANLKALDQYIHFGMITGVSRFTKLSVFSCINNLNDISLDQEFQDICGITEDEIHTYLDEGIKEFSKALGIQCDEAYQALKKNYDGYHFSKALLDIYNPFSLLCALDKKETGSYWFSTATPGFLIRRLYDEKVNLPESLNSEVTPLMLSSAEISHESIIALLFQTGYLTIKKYDEEWKTYHLGIPNREVKEGIFREMTSVYQDKDRQQSLTTIRTLVKSLNSGHPEDFLTALKQYLSGIPYSVIQNYKELYFENNIYIIANLIGLYCEAETATSNGRIDLTIKTKDYIYVIELKLDKSAEEALKQIQEKNYWSQYAVTGKKIFLIGVNFSSKTRNIQDSIITTP